MSLGLIALGSRLLSNAGQNHDLHSMSDAAQISSCAKLTPHDRFMSVPKYQLVKITSEFLCCHTAMRTSKPLCAVPLPTGFATYIANIDDLRVKADLAKAKEKILFDVLSLIL